MSYETTLEELMHEHPELMLLTAENRAAIRSLATRAGERFIDVGICEQTLVGVAAGLALSGRVPMVHALAPFLTMRAFEFIRTDVGIPNLPVKLVGFIPGILSDGNGPTHQAIEDVALMRNIPGMRVLCPADEDELCACLPAMIQDRGPAYLRYNQLPARVRHKGDWELGKAEVLQSGRDVCLLSYGALFAQALEATERLDQLGYSVGLVNLRSLAPVDEAALLEAFESKLVVTLEDHFVRGALRSLVCELAVERGANIELLPIGLQSWFRAGHFQAALEHAALDADSIVERIVGRLEEGR
ncbi:MAG: transketolase [Myxococcales bacterium]|nr:transketolase [Myxococcales bacterium]